MSCTSISFSLWKEMCDVLCEEIYEGPGNKMLCHKLNERTGGITGYTSVFW
jgi:hypothetical protein